MSSLRVSRIMLLASRFLYVSCLLCCTAQSEARQRCVSEGLLHSGRINKRPRQHIRASPQKAPPSFWCLLVKLLPSPCGTQRYWPDLEYDIRCCVPLDEEWHMVLYAFRSSSAFWIGQACTEHDTAANMVKLLEITSIRGQQNAQTASPL